MVELYNIDIATHERFARDQQAIEAFRKQYHISPTGPRTISLQTTILDFIPKPPALTLLLQLYQKKNWALFSVPKNFYTQARPITSYIVPSLGSSEKQDADVQKIRALLKQKAPHAVQRREQQDQKQEQKREETEEEIVEEGEIIIALLEKGIKETNNMVDYIISRMNQFVQG